jgi:hypothetical protein
VLTALFSSLTAKAAAAGAAGLLVAGGTAAVVLPEKADNRAREAVEVVEGAGGEAPERDSTGTGNGRTFVEGTDTETTADHRGDEGTGPPEETFAAFVHALLASLKDGTITGEEFGRQVSDAAQEHGRAQREAAPMPDEAQERSEARGDQPERPVVDRPAPTGGEDETGRPDDIPAGPPADTPAGPPEDRPGR